jgi:hypothetical protein
MPQTDLEIRWTILFHNPFYHPAVAFRRSCFEKADRYRPEEAVSYDHYLWFEMLPFCRARNLADRLTQYRCNPRGLTSLYAIKPRNRTHRIREALWQRLGLVYDLYDAAHARNAKARAAQQVKAGNLSKADKKKVDAKADKVLNKKS